MILHLADAVSKGFQILLHMVDTDVVVLLVSAVAKLDIYPGALGTIWDRKEIQIYSNSWNCYIYWSQQISVPKRFRILGKTNSSIIALNSSSTTT